MKLCLIPVLSGCQVSKASSGAILENTGNWNVVVVAVAVLVVVAVVVLRFEHFIE